MYILVESRGQSRKSLVVRIPTQRWLSVVQLRQRGGNQAYQVDIEVAKSDIEINHTSSLSLLCKAIGKARGCCCLSNTTFARCDDNHCSSASEPPFYVSCMMNVHEHGHMIFLTEEDYGYWKLTGGKPRFDVSEARR